jgi:hypothetical protein
LPPADRLFDLEVAAGLRDDEPRSGRPAVPLHHCQFLDFTAMVGDYKYMRRTVLALAEDTKERKRIDTILAEAQRLKKLETEG